MQSGPRVWNISGTQPFLRTLAQGVLAGEVIEGFDPRANPFSLADATILVPNRRAARALATCFLEESGNPSLILPNIRPIGDLEGDEAFDPADQLALPTVLPGLERTLAMTRLVRGWTTALSGPAELPNGGRIIVPSSPADAVYLAIDLLALLDQAATEEVQLQGLETLVPSEYAAYWQLTTAFLKIATDVWPQYIAGRGAIEPMELRSRLIDRFAAKMTGQTLPGPLIAAGSTASVPATRRLLAAIARHRQGAVIIPGLDRALDTASYEAILPKGEEGVPSHPQYGLKALLDGLGLRRMDVPELGAPTAVHHVRDRVISETFRPAVTTDRWSAFAAQVDSKAVSAAFAGHSFLQATHEGQEALAIAIALREVLETPGRTAALVTPYQPLARRVVAELKRFGLEVEIAAGEPLAETAAGILSSLVTDIALGEYDPVAISALLGNPLVRIGQTRAFVRVVGRMLGNGVLRGPRLKGTGEALLEAVERARSASPNPKLIGLTPLTRMDDESWQSVADLAQSLVAALEPLHRLAGEPQNLETFLAAHAQVCVSLMRGDTGALPDGYESDALETFFQEAKAASVGAFPLEASEYPGVVRALMAGRSVRGLTPDHVPIRILGPLDARLQRFDLVVLGGLDETLWPQQTTNDAWLSRPMRRELALEPPERRIGLSAHDASQHLLADHVMITRAVKRGGTPTVPSRWWQRLQTVLGEKVTRELLARGEVYLDYARRIDHPPPQPRLKQPCPVPDVALRPTGLSVTEIEILIRDPYAIYARRVLGLEPLDEIGQEPDFAERGIAIHAALSTFTQSWRGPLNAEAVAALVACGRQAFKPLEAYPAVHALWWPRFVQIAHYVIEQFEPAQGDVIRYAEVQGRWDVLVDGTPFRLTGRADRIDVSGNVGTIIDFKTGSAPAQKQIETLFAPQMPLEAAMVRHGAFGGLPPLKIDALVHVELKGIDGKNAEKRYPGAKAKFSVEELVDEAIDRLIRLVRQFRQPDHGYLSHLAMHKTTSTGRYDHLARVAEWSIAESGQDDGDDSA